MPSILSSVTTHDDQNEEKPVKFPRPDTSQMTPFKPSAGAGKDTRTMPASFSNSEKSETLLKFCIDGNLIVKMVLSLVKSVHS